MYRRVQVGSRQCRPMLCRYLHRITIEWPIEPAQIYNVIQVRQQLASRPEFDEVWNLLRTDDECRVLYDELIASGPLFNGRLPPAFCNDSDDREEALQAFLERALACDPTACNIGLNRFLMVSEIADDDLRRWISPALNHLDKSTSLLHRKLALVLHRAMNILLSSAWDVPMRELIYRSWELNNCGMVGFGLPVRMMLDNFINHGGGPRIVRSVVGNLPASVKQFLSSVVEPEPQATSPESQLIIRRFFAGLHLYLEYKWVGEGLGISRPTFNRVHGQQAPSVVTAHIGINVDLTKFLVAPGTDPMDHLCVEAVAEIALAHELTHVFTSYLFGDGRTPAVYPFIQYGNDPHSGFYCERVGNNGYIGLLKCGIAGRRVQLGSHDIHWKGNFAVPDEWLKDYVSARDNPNLLTRAVLDLQRLPLLPVAEEDCWVLDDAKHRWCIHMKRGRCGRQRQSNIQSPGARRRLFPD